MAINLWTILHIKICALRNLEFLKPVIVTVKSREGNASPFLNVFDERSPGLGNNVVL